MKIGNSADQPPLPVAPTATPASPAATSAAGASAIPAAADPSARIELSTAAATLLAGGGSAEFDAEKVARIAQAIESGTFSIDAGAIADKLIANAQELLNKTQN